MELKKRLRIAEVNLIKELAEVKAKFTKGTQKHDEIASERKASCISKQEERAEQAVCAPRDLQYIVDCMWLAL